MLRSLMDRAVTPSDNASNSASDAPAITAGVSAEMHLPRRRTTPWEPTSSYGRAWLWICNPILDPHTNYPSGPRCLVWTVTIGAIAGHEISATLAAVLIPTMWGYSMVKDAQSRTTLTLAAAASSALTYGRTFTKTVTENIRRVITGRDPEKGFDPSRPEPDPSEGAS